MVYEDIETIKWKDMRQQMREADSCMGKLKAFMDWAHATRHQGEWQEDTKVRDSASATTHRP